MTAPEQPAGEAETPPTPREPKPGIPPGTPDWWGHVDAPWSAETPQLWVDEVDKAGWYEDGSTFWKALACPRCRHQMSIVLRPGIRAESEDAGGDAGGDAKRTPASCNCETDTTVHEGRPEARTRGCGQRGWVERPA